MFFNSVELNSALKGKKNFQLTICEQFCYPIVASLFQIISLKKFMEKLRIALRNNK